MKLFVEQSKMADVVHQNYLLMPVIVRFGIPLGFGEKSVQEVCRDHRIDVPFFLAIINAFTYEQYFPEKRLHSFNVLMIVDYLKKTHFYYTHRQLPLIEKLLSSLLRRSSSDEKNLKLIKKFFLDYKKEFLHHLDREEKTTFPYVRSVYRLVHSHSSIARKKTILSKYAMHVYEEEHADMDAKLFDLKNILIKYIHVTPSDTVYQEIVFELFRLEKDVQDHTRIENNILLPLVAEMEDRLFYPEEHSRRTVGKKALAILNPQFHQQEQPPAAGVTDGQFRIAPAKAGTKEIKGLTSRELAVLQLVGCGMLNKQIADRLDISQHTVISHRKNITRKLQIKTVAGLTIYALLNGLISQKNIS